MPIDNPGLGSYEHDVERNRQIGDKWPRMFGRPVELPPVPPMRALRTEMIEDRDFKRHRNRLSYMSLYFQS